MSQQFEEVIQSKKQLREILGIPSEVVLKKTINKIDKHCKQFIAHSPFIVVGTADAAGNVDVSPKGDPAGFVQVLDEKTLAIPDRLGNKIGASFDNILENPKVSVIFFIPGIRETLRVGGTAQIVTDKFIRERLAHNGKVPNLALIVHVEEAFMHCAKCFIRSKIWTSQDPDIKEKIPSLATILKDHAALDTPVDVLNKYLKDSDEKELY